MYDNFFEKPLPDFPQLFLYHTTFCDKIQGRRV